MRRIIEHSILVTLLILLVNVTPMTADQVNTNSLTDEPIDYALIVTGGELLRGVYADGHTHFITRTLEPLGCRCVASMCIGDTRKDLLDALRFADDHADLIIVTGGLGPTKDDVTREVLSEYTGIPIKEHPEVVEKIRKRFAGREIKENLLRQTRTPVKGDYFLNPNGTAVGLVFDDKKQVVVALPGPPSELQPMVKDELIPFLSERFGIHSIGCSLTMRFVGIGESSIDQVMRDHMTLPKDLMISSLFEQGRVDLTFSLPGDTDEDKKRLKALEADLLKHIKEYMYSDTGKTLEEHIIDLLGEGGHSLVTSEVGSGGAIAASLNHAEGASNHFKGGYIAPSNQIMMAMLDIPAQQDGQNTRSPETTALLHAERASKQSDSEWAIAVSEIITEGNQSPHVWVAVGSHNTGFKAKRINLRGRGESAQKRLVTNALDFFRRSLNQ